MVCAAISALVYSLAAFAVEPEGAKLDVAKRRCKARGAARLYLRCRRAGAMPNRRSAALVGLGYDVHKADNVGRTRLLAPMAAFPQSLGAWRRRGGIFRRSWRGDRRAELPLAARRASRRVGRGRSAQGLRPLARRIARSGARPPPANRPLYSRRLPRQSVRRRHGQGHRRHARACQGRAAKRHLHHVLGGAKESALDRLSDNDPNPNSVYTRTLLPRLKASGRITDIARDVRREVRELAASVAHVQTPAYYDEVVGDFCPAGCEAKTAAAPPEITPAEVPPPPAEAKPAEAPAPAPAVRRSRPPRRSPRKPCKGRLPDMRRSMSATGSPPTRTIPTPSVQGVEIGDTIDAARGYSRLRGGRPRSTRKSAASPSNSPARYLQANHPELAKPAPRSPQQATAIPSPACILAFCMKAEMAWPRTKRKRLRLFRQAADAGDRAWGARARATPTRTEAALPRTRPRRSAGSARPRMPAMPGP